MDDRRSPPSPPQEPGSALPLHEAALVLCDTRLVADLRGARAEFDKAWGRPPAPHVFPTKNEDDATSFIARGEGLRMTLELSRFNARGEADPRLQAGRGLCDAVERLEADLRQRIESREIVLEGLRIKPTLSRELERIPPIWARRIEFYWQRQSIKVDEIEFDEVVGMPYSALSDTDIHTAPDRPRRGRPRFPWDKMVAIARTRLADRLPSNKSEADVLLREFCRHHPDEKPPRIGTIEDHVTEIYAVVNGKSAPL